MTGIATWWDGIPGLDSRTPFGDVLFADRFAALACAMRVLAVDPSRHDQVALVQAGNMADKFLDHFQGADNVGDSYVRRLTVAIACTGARGKPNEPNLARDLIRLAELYRQYLTKPPDKRGGRI